MTNNMLDSTVNINLTLECLRAAACGGSYELMDEVALLDQIESRAHVLAHNISDQDRHEYYCKIAAAALIMAMRLDHVEKVNE